MNCQSRALRQMSDVVRPHTSIVSVGETFFLYNQISSEIKSKLGTSVKIYSNVMEGKWETFLKGTLPIQGAA